MIKIPAELDNNMFYADFNLNADLDGIVLSPESYPVRDVMGHDNSKSEGNLGCCTKEGDYASN